ncbi:hypothetical protein COEREDRAFT_88139 [Coemansia reversa NRRL 1564]|uniref:Uncharacterized protein n=1 Tax=Coemansia reversa (strain ATCC 12441 / NRRL 1564) TaxID=763665 RepID=A0A2G5B7L4_COERN|nr:hypothetical protein COEREDRAFT_88139 [Coemansia reversa NRRL 1564]|eukprot:PIA15033.1 hypothetical protein COEREDRAFT_88139 [Coemansia reversa NRRL 1564]
MSKNEETPLAVFQKTAAFEENKKRFAGIFDTNIELCSYKIENGFYIFKEKSFTIYLSLDKKKYNIIHNDDTEPTDLVDIGLFDDDPTENEKPDKQSSYDGDNDSSNDEDKTPVENERDGRNESNKSCHGSKRIAII